MCECVCVQRGGWLITDLWVLILFGLSEREEKIPRHFLHRWHFEVGRGRRKITKVQINLVTPETCVQLSPEFVCFVGLYPCWVSSAADSKHEMTLNIYHGFPGIFLIFEHSSVRLDKSIPPAAWERFLFPCWNKDDGQKQPGLTPNSSNTDTWTVVLGIRHRHRHTKAPWGVIHMACFLHPQINCFQCGYMEGALKTPEWHRRGAQALPSAYFSGFDGCALR